MPKLVGNSLQSPRTWLAVGALCIGVSLLLGYYLDQRFADRVLAQKVGQPEQVLIQDFVPELNMNLVREVNALGQIAEGERIMVNVGDVAEPNWLAVTPIYAVGEELLPLATSHLHKTRSTLRRPLGREAATELKRQRHAIAGISGLALAFAVQDAGTVDVAESANIQGPLAVLDAFGPLSLVKVEGAVITGNTLRDKVADVLFAQGVPSAPDSLIVATSSLEMTLTESDAGIEAARWWWSFAGFLAMLFGVLSPYMSVVAMRRQKQEGNFQSVDAIGVFPAVGIFQPIVTQDELALDEKRASVEGTLANRLRRRLLRVTEFATNSLGGLRSPR